tara:strand:- start:446 stop:712 length:267 start_codon:yes stop_codon:yes gene_type:complete
MKLLNKTNPKATGRTVVRHAVSVSLIGTSLYALIHWWNNRWTEWPTSLVAASVLLLLVGGLWEWQVPIEEDDATDRENGSAPRPLPGE